MTRLPLLPAFVTALALAQVGCFANTSDVEPLDSVGLDLLGSDDNGHTGVNGLMTTHYQPNAAHLATAAWTPILTQQGDLHANILQLLSGTGGAETFRYAARCALPEMTSVTDGTEVFEGYGILNSTSNWPNAGLNLLATADLMSCMAVHLNPSGTEVPIKLGGPSINDQSAVEQPDGDEYTFQEALWASEYVTGAGGWVIHVWPLSDMLSQCSQSVTDAMTTRVCGQGAAICNLVVHANLNTCTQTTSGYDTCDGKKVIQTWLKPGDFTTLHPGCARPVLWR